MRIEVLGVRHHGPGSARSVLGALAELDPDQVVIEGPTELDTLVRWAADPDLVPPVAGLVYAVDEPRRAAFYPFADFSPEWVALRWALAHGRAVRFADLPATHSLAMQESVVPSRSDPLGTLARAAGYDDPERWWEDAVEHRGDSSLERFGLLVEAMGRVRSDAEEDLENERREAAMRRVLRAVVKEDRERVAVVCGAYHAPALHPDAWPSAAADNRLLARLPRVRVTATWAPWTAGRLAVASGYGAGVRSPGWYQHLFRTWLDDRPEEVVPGWLTRVARALRDEGIDAAPATVVEAVRLAEALAAVRARPSVGLSELTDASLAVLTQGSELPLQLIDRKLVVGEQLGQVPESAPLVPLAQDLAKLQRFLRLKPSPTPTTVTLDLRKPSQLQRSLLLHRLELLGIPWGEKVDPGGTLGTFKEAWELEWQPEFAVALVEAGVHGTTVIEAATSKVAEAAREASSLATLGSLIESALVAELPGALSVAVEALAEQTAHQHDTLSLLEAVEPLARTQRYGDVRKADTSRVRTVLRTVVVRAAVGLRSACLSLDDDAAAAMRQAIEGAHRGVTLADVEADRWREALSTVAADDRIHGLVAGRVNRLLLDGGHLGVEEAARRLSRHLSVAAPGPVAAAWLDGFLEGDAVLLVHDPVLLRVVDEWIAEIDDTTFEDLLPLLRRTFSRFQSPERRQIGDRVRNLSAGPVVEEEPVDVELAMPAVRRMASLIGIEVAR